MISLHKLHAVRLMVSVATTASVFFSTSLSFAQTTATVQANAATSSPAPVAVEPYKPKLKYDDSLAILFGGGRLSKILPCGCHSRNLGGIDKEAAMITAYQQVTSSPLLLDAGGFFREFTDPDLNLQTWYLLQSLRLMKYQAINVAYTDFKHGIDELKRLQKEIGLPFISANILDAQTSKTVFEPYKIFEVPNGGRMVKIGVIGVTAPNARVSTPLEDEAPPKITPATETTSTAEGKGGAAADEVAGGSNRAVEFALSIDQAASSGPVSQTRYEVQDETEALIPLAQKLRPQCDVLVLLAFDGATRSKRIAESVGIFDVVIAGDTYQQYPSVRTGKENRTLWMSGEHEGRYLGLVEITFEKDKTINEKEGSLLPIDQNIVVDPQLTRMIDAYMRDKAKLPPPRSRPAERIYAGANRCALCHKAQFDQWKSSRHAKAIASLRDKKMEYNPDCLRCHVVDFRKAGGFTDLMVTPHLANVQCESCHGPAQKHVVEEQQIAKMSKQQREVTKRAAKMNVKTNAEFCVQCHDQANDPNFDFARDIKLVDHSTSDTERKGVKARPSH